MKELDLRGKRMPPDKQVRAAWEAEWQVKADYIRGKFQR